MKTRIKRNSRAIAVYSWFETTTSQAVHRRNPKNRNFFRYVARDFPQYLSEDQAR